ncbi:MAG: LysM peptidoglycan-binding domain-containing protein [Phycisphaeraceae bacterium]|nr:LysM peptidoglycan-binding domain-containing protein [Phycisphaeraceae bacterium]
MSDGPGRLFGVLCVLAGVWIGTYWLWEPSKPRTTVDESEPVRIEGLESIPITPPPVEPVRPPIPAAGTNGGAATPSPVRMVTRVEPPEYREYVVQPGDDWAKISRKFFGDASKARVLTRHNPLVSPDLLRPGTTLRIPIDPDNVQGKVVEVAVPAPEGASAASPTPPTPEDRSAKPAAPAGRRHVIKRDETLWGIARQYYGKGTMWRVIAEANTERIPDPNNPPVGVEIVIPDAAQ